MQQVGNASCLIKHIALMIMQNYSAGQDVVFQELMMLVMFYVCERYLLGFL
jgi:hypothetical protein